MQLSDHVFRGVTQSLCPDCLRVVPAKILSRGERVYFRKRCPQHGVREDFVCSDVNWFDRPAHPTPGKVPRQQAVMPQRGCPLDCGLCTEHEQHTCVALLEITESCNLTCPLCFAGSAPGGQHLSLEACQAAIDALVAAEGQPEVLQLSGGEPTIHPQFFDVLDYACRQPIDIIMLNTNGLRLARDAAFRERLANYRERVEIYLQFDGLEDVPYQQLRGESLLDHKLAAVQALGEAGFFITLVCTLQAGVNDHQPGPIVEFGLQRPFVTGISFQPTTYSGRYFLPADLEMRVTFPDVIQAICQAHGELCRPADFFPLPCAHPNAHTLSYLYRGDSGAIPLTRFMGIEQNIDLLANGIVFDRARARQLVAEYLSRTCCRDGSCGSPLPARPAAPAGSLPILSGVTTANEPAAIDDSPSQALTERESALAQEFFQKAASQQLNQSDVLRITVTSFMDAYNFDIRQLMQSCVHHVLPSGHIIPFSAYNVLYRDGHVSWPQLAAPATESIDLQPTVDSVQSASAAGPRTESRIISPTP